MSHGLTRREREVTDRNEIVRILDTAKFLHLGMVDGDEPYVVPMNYGYTLENDQLTFYLHGAMRGRKLDVLRRNPKICFTLECDVVPFEGDVACRYGMTYSSIMGVGTAVIVEDVAEKQQALSLLMKAQTGGDFEFSERMVSVVSVIRLEVSSFTAKHRPLPTK